MGYDLHITRGGHWAENDGARISVDEWLAVVENDKELTLSPGNASYLADWSGPSKHAEPWLAWHDGNIYSKNPDSALLRKMVQLAAQLRARVQGDDGEFYTGDEQLDDHHVTAERSYAARSRSLWHRITGR